MILRLTDSIGAGVGRCRSGPRSHRFATEPSFTVSALRVSIAIAITYLLLVAALVVTP